MGRAMVKGRKRRKGWLKEKEEGEGGGAVVELEGGGGVEVADRERRGGEEVRFRDRRVRKKGVLEELLMLEAMLLGARGRSLKEKREGRAKRRARHSLA